MTTLFEPRSDKNYLMPGIPLRKNQSSHNFGTKIKRNRSSQEASNLIAQTIPDESFLVINQMEKKNDELLIEEDEEELEPKDSTERVERLLSKLG